MIVCMFIQINVVFYFVMKTYYLLRDNNNDIKEKIKKETEEITKLKMAVDKIDAITINKKMNGLEIEMNDWTERTRKELEGQFITRLDTVKKEIEEKIDELDNRVRKGNDIIHMVFYYYPRGVENDDKANSIRYSLVNNLKTKFGTNIPIIEDKYECLNNIN